MGARYLFLSLNGRIGRLQWWIGTTLVEGITTALMWLAGVPVLVEAPTFKLRLMGFLIQLLPIYPNFALTVKRLHDRDRSAVAAAPLFATFAAMLIGGLFGFPNETSPHLLRELVLMIIILVVLTVYLVELGFRKGTVGLNRFGPGPVAGLRSA